jgi:hypothetical protein
LAVYSYNWITTINRNSQLCCCAAQGTKASAVYTGNTAVTNYYSHGQLQF